MTDETNSFYHEEAYKLLQEGYQKQMDRSLDEAVELYKQSIELCPTAEAHTYLGWAYSAKGRYEEAIDECKRAIEIDPDYGNPYNDIGAYLIDLGKMDDAVEWLEKAVNARRYDAYCYPYYNLGKIWEKKGQWMKSLKCYQNALIEKADYGLAKKAINRIYSLYN
ncbi:MAG: tetratricopeptide repeat protein [Candidatus Omnitrophica bacterium]|nr:tetratricopeptide repeat protein [Candidatus Omnitrophota bacterium]